MSVPLVTKIVSGELFDEAYMAVNQQFEYCFGSSRKTYDTVARYVLGKNGKIRDINKDLQVGVISSNDIKTIFMLTSTGSDIISYNQVSWIDEKRLFTYAQLNYPDAVYKFAPYWSDGLCFDIHIPSLNLIIENEQYFDDNAAPIEKERQAEEEQKFNKKRALCEEHGITFYPLGQPHPHKRSKPFVTY